ncbi:hypothetical protein EJ03DRAFT_165854 [Teratosphaeria nubilosa]|uniref:Dynactin subunit n=1 Tax=Teratosphaeria nubilosa TaxID=161662 RepID=A0A6G1L2I7_9PEZI|nr:hypothetical protein EJ03DRAFT_165854 [Teratosphaeria nubilosa]
MAETSRLAALPGYDTAPDVYETPDLTDDSNTTVLTEQTSPRSAPESSQSSEEDDEDDEETNGVLRRRLYPQRARSRFDGARVGGRGVDLGDRVDGGRRGYSLKSRGAGNAEGLSTRIARLKREIDECRDEAERQDESARNIDELGKLLVDLETLSSAQKQKQERPKLQGRSSTPGQWPVEGSNDAEITDEQTLSRVADFDGRIHALEQALGLSSLDAATMAGDAAVATPLLPSLVTLDQQLSALVSATSLTNLEAASSRISALRRDAESLSEGEDGISAEDKAKLEQLYTLLPSLLSLQPTVPPLLARLRSLRTLHTTAANAVSDLEDVEKRQAEMEKELKMWREGLESVEEAVERAEEANGRNGRVVEGWVKDLDKRIRELGLK